MPVQTVFENLEAGMSVHGDYGGFRRHAGGSKAVLHFASQSLAKRPRSADEDFIRQRHPKPIARSLTGHQITYARRIGWHEMGNGELIQQAEEAGYEVLLSTTRISAPAEPYRPEIALVILGNQQWPVVKLHLDRIAAAVKRGHTGSFIEVDIPFE